VRAFSACSTIGELRCSSMNRRYKRSASWSASRVPTSSSAVARPKIACGLSACRHLALIPKDDLRVVGAPLPLLAPLSGGLEQGAQARRTGRPHTGHWAGWARAMTTIAR